MNSKETEEKKAEHMRSTKQVMEINPEEQLWKVHVNELNAPD